ncbi:DUF983 domain-containing protein [Neptunicoccus sediminis]|uniref:DUF983 domain-containing protein n=1 Tax=Neptunicoccus sediminis TaxID=1892596 RepID=UPI000845E992|nr:DUF983 domain-containing protein [Neptunicoccus sediminis]
MENNDHIIAPNVAEREAKPAMLRGWRRKCPNCGTGPLLKGYLTVRDTCEVCSEELHHHRADDGPAYVTILICGHLLAPLMMLMFEVFRPNALVLSVGFMVAFVALALYMLPRIKGVFVGLQWAKRMHGFGRDVTPVAAE